MDVQNYGLLDPVPTDPFGYVSKDMEWAAVPWGQKFIIVHKGQQVHTSNSYKEARDYINKKIKTSKKKSTSSLEQFL